MGPFQAELFIAVLIAAKKKSSEVMEKVRKGKIGETNNSSDLFRYHNWQFC